MTNVIKKWIKGNFLQLSLLLFFVFIAYFNSLGNGFVSDDLAIRDSKIIGDISYFISRPHVFIQPLIYYFIYKVGGLNPALFRFGNIIFHVFTVWTIYVLLSELTNKKRAFFTAALFSVHPILTEAVTWISGGNYVRYSFFFLFSLFCYFLSDKFNSRKIYYISLFALLFSLFSLANSIVFPLAIILFEFIFLNLKKNWKRIIPVFLISLYWIIFYLSQIKIRAESVINQSGGVQSNIYYNPFTQLPIVIVTYLKLIIWPSGLTLYHSELNFGLPEFLIYLFAFIVFCGLFFYFFKKNRIIFFWLSFFIITLIPVLTPFRISWIVAERYVYLGTLGILFIFGYLIDSLTKNKKTGKLGYFIFVLIMLALISRTIIRNIDWRSEDNLWIATGKVSPSYPLTHNNLGDVYTRKGDFELAIFEFKKAIELNPNYSDAYHNLGNVYRIIGKDEEALVNYKKAVEFNPNLWQSYNNLAAIYFDRGDFESAEANIKKAIAIYPENQELKKNLELLYQKTNQKD